jgi:hypothetical protein
MCVKDEDNGLETGANVRKASKKIMLIDRIDRSMIRDDGKRIRLKKLSGI